MFRPLLEFPDVELWATGALRAALAARNEAYTTGVYVDRKVPNPRRPRMVIVRRDGGGQLDRVREAPTISVQVWAQTEADAADLARLVAALIWALPDGNPVSLATQLMGPTAVADESGQPLRLMTFELVTRAAQLSD